MSFGAQTLDAQRLDRQSHDASTAAPDADDRASANADIARRVVAFERWRKRSRLVHFYRRALPAGMVAIVLFAVSWVLVHSLAKRLVEGVGTIHMLHPRFYGRNDKGESYVMSADEAVRSGADPDRIALTHPKMVQSTKSAPAPEVLTALRGVYHEKTRLLDLYGHVQASDGQGNHFATEFTHLDMPKNSAVGQSAMSGYGPDGTIAASSYGIYDKGQHIVLTGNVHTHLVNHSTSKPAASPPAPMVPASNAPAGPRHG